VSDSKKLYVLGYSGHAYVVIDVADSMGIPTMGYFDKMEASVNPYHLAYLGSDKEGGKFKETDYIFPAVGDNLLRKSMVEIIRKQGWKEITLIDASAHISPKARISESTLVAPRALINSGALVGEGCIINSGAIVEHGCQIGNFTHLAPGAILAGNVAIGQNCFVGAGAVIKQGVVIGDQVVIGAGSVVLKNIPSGETWVGNPSKKLR
jgi:sugar O-acyltransferase (sialic acid O-acetyltransferase NeuD family)